MFAAGNLALREKTDGNCVSLNLSLTADCSSTSAISLTYIEPGILGLRNQLTVDLYILKLDVCVGVVKTICLCWCGEK